METSKDHFLEICEIFHSCKFPVVVEEWEESEMPTIFCEGTFVMSFSKEKIFISFDISCPPDYSATIAALLYQQFSIPSLLEIADNYYVNPATNEVIFGVDASIEFCH